MEAYPEVGRRIGKDHRNGAREEKPRKWLQDAPHGVLSPEAGVRGAVGRDRRF